MKERFRAGHTIQLVDHHALESSARSTKKPNQNQNKKPEETKAVLLDAKVVALVMRKDGTWAKDTWDMKEEKNLGTGGCKEEQR